MHAHTPMHVHTLDHVHMCTHTHTHTPPQGTDDCMLTFHEEDNTLV